MGESVAGPPATFFVARDEVARERHDRDAAREAFEGAVAKGLLELPRGPTWTITLVWAADTCVWLDDRPRAARLHELLAPFTEVMTWQYGPVGRAVGRLAGTLQRRDEPERRLRKAGHDKRAIGGGARRATR